jgi:protein-S-isoprenylcysteine O-methyltransferase Ste14
VNRVAALIYGTVSYAIFFGTFLYAIGFLANAYVPKGIDSGEAGSWPVAVAVNLILLTIFALQHSVMARPGFKRWWTRFVPEPVERSTYVLFSSLAFILLFWGWQPLPTAVWSLEGEVARTVVSSIFLLGVCTVLYSTFLIDHFDLFGLRQVVLYFQGKDYSAKRFVTPALYKHIRHPLYVGWFITFWMTPNMTAGHLMMAGVTTAYILVAILFEERDLVDALGEDYARYREATPMFVPRLTAKQSQPTQLAARGEVG